mmetsp:Transcript_34903/g.56177  ORF Transcript_34903/g.56177 Transcript_34903/m.56177 type:complete len:288 (+) Transcript_34903:66-929(+)
MASRGICGVFVIILISSVHLTRSRHIKGHFRILSLGKLRGGTLQTEELNFDGKSLPRCPFHGNCDQIHDPNHCREWRHPCVFSLRSFEACPQSNDPEHRRLYDHIDTRDELDLLVLSHQDTVSDTFRLKLNFKKDVSKDKSEEATDILIEAMDAMDAGNKRDALKLVTRAITIKPTISSVLKRAEILLEMEMPNHALIDCGRVLRENPRYPRPYKIAARAFCMLGKWQEALQKVSRANELFADESSIKLHNDLLKKLRKGDNGSYTAQRKGNSPNVHQLDSATKKLV